MGKRLLTKLLANLWWGLVPAPWSGGAPAAVQHLVILPWSKSTTQNPDRPKAAEGSLWSLCYTFIDLV